MAKPFESGLGFLVEELAADEGAINRTYGLSYASAHIVRSQQLVQEWQERVRTLDGSTLSRVALVDQILLLNYLDGSHARLKRRELEAHQLAHSLPFAAHLLALDEMRRRMERPEPEFAANLLSQLTQGIDLEAAPQGDAIAAGWCRELQAALERCKEFYVGYDPQLDWWVRKPLAEAATRLDDFVNRCERLPEGDAVIPGRPVGRDALMEDLRLAMVAYSPEELIAIGEREYQGCLKEMLRASRELGCGDDWKQALERVKDTAVPPGEQPGVVRGLALEAIEWVESRELLTVPALAKETWRMEMMSAERQKVNPFFLGGESIIVSYPTDTMTHEEKRMSMRGNNPNFSRPTVQRELIPGHHLQAFMNARHRPYRQLFSTPFWIEGWTLYWELLLWELGFPRTPEERIGMLFWRMHRCVRIVFSLRFHMGEMTTAECVEMLVDQVGHERANAEGEVRRSFNGLYPPLYQATYMIGGLMFRAMQREFVVGGSMSYREFHDAILRENEMPLALLRAVLKRGPLRQEEIEGWRLEGPMYVSRSFPCSVSGTRTCNRSSINQTCYL